MTTFDKNLLGTNKDARSLGFGKRRPRSARGGGDLSGGGPMVVMPNGQSLPLDSVVTHFGGGGTGFSGAQTSAGRSFIVFPEMDTRKEISTFSRQEMLRRSRWLYNNVGFAKRIVLALSRMIGALHPSPQSGDSDWNEEALRVWWRIVESPLLYERSGKFNFRTYQRFLSRRWLIDGDVLSVFTRGETGTSMVAPYEAHQIGDPIQRTPYQRRSAGDFSPGWIDGVQVDKGNRLKKVRLLHPDDDTKFTDVPASSCHLSAFWERAGQARGVTPFHSAISQMIDIRDLTGDMMAGVKRSNLIAFYLHSSSPSTPMFGEDGLAGGLSEYLKGGNGIDQAASKFSIEDVMESGVIPDMPGFEPKVLHDARPHPHQMNLLAWFVREMSLSFDLPPEAIWDMGSLNGTTTRLLKEDVEQTLINYREELLEPFCQRNWFDVIGTEIAAGFLAEPKSGRWDEVDWKHPRKKTIDRGSEGRLNLEEAKRPGMRTLDRHFSETQEDWRDEGTKWFHEIDWFTDKARDRGWSEQEIQALRQQWLSLPPGSNPMEMVE